MCYTLRLLTTVVCLVAATAAAAASDRQSLVVRPFTTAEGVSLPYDLHQLQVQLVAELTVMLGSGLEVVREASEGRRAYTIDGRITSWRAGNAAKRLVIGLGSGREAADLVLTVQSPDGRTLLETRDTIRTNFYSQAAGSTGTLAHPFAQKIAGHLKRLDLR